ncbi:MAG: alpha/beta fold hydrolase [Balneolaceae bacterium]
MNNTLHTILITILLLSSGSVFAQSITGDWYGSLNVQGMNMKLVFHIMENDDGYSATFDSPGQGASGIPFTSAVRNENTITLSADNIAATYTAALENEKLNGIWKQGVNEFELVMSRTDKEIKGPNRPQEPNGVLPYKAEKVFFENSAADISLAGTLTLPEGNGPFPAVILISGSGPQDRDEYFMGHRPFLVIADHLTRQGIAVLRYDDRGFGESTGNHGTASSLDFATDAASAVAFLKTRSEIDNRHIGLAGHSEGGLIAPIVAADNAEVAFIILLAGPGVSGVEIQKQQIDSFAPMMGLSPDQIKEEKHNIEQIAAIVRETDLGEELNQKITEFFLSKMPQGDTFMGMNKEEFISQKLMELNRPWYKYFIDHDPAEFLKEVNVPILAINGSKDIQVSPQNLENIREATSHNDQVTITEYPEMNHLFQKCNSCMMSEYPDIETTISPIVLEDMSKWIWDNIQLK